MKKIILITILLFLAVPLTKAGGLTLIEKILKQGETKVYVQFVPVIHDPGAVGGSTSPCASKKFDEVTEFTSDFKAHTDKIIKMLNDRMEIEALKKGDITAVPVKKEMNGMKIYDWSKAEDPFFALVTVSGSYKASADPSSGGVENSLWIPAQLQFIEMDGEKMDIVEQTSLGTVISAKKTSKSCEGIDYFKENFPLDDHIEKFEENYTNKIERFAKKHLKKYKKAMKKKKK
ncbi:MAG: hypothetical protein WDZ35_12260 [Crocinitomicaceae bacterium]